MLTHENVADRCSGGDILNPKILADDNTSAASEFNKNRVGEDALWLRREFIVECGDIVASLGIALAEAAWRGSDVTVETTLRQIIAATKTACATFREIAPVSNEGGRQ